MPLTCCAYGCKNRYNANNSNKLSFHRFPKDPNLRSKWVLSTKRLNFNPGPNTVICSAHFKPENYYSYASGVGKLRENVVPTIFKIDRNLRKSRKVVSESIMNETKVDVLDLPKEPDVIKEAQSELATLDLLVCGACHSVFHYVEDFQNHKQPSNCSKISTFKCEQSEKPSVWGFTLWKAKYLKTVAEKQDAPPTSWEVYQKWCKVPTEEKDVWIAAGQNLQFSQKIGKAPIEIVAREQYEDKEDIASGDGNEKIKKAVIKEEKFGPRQNMTPGNKEEFVVEKIVSKRFNPRRRFWEYEVKWKNYDETTFEPMLHLDNCRELVREFEENLKVIKEKEKQLTAKPRGRPRLSTSSSASSTAGKVMRKKSPSRMSIGPIISSSGGRPQRSSKQKALNQVKQWCGSISDDDLVKAVGEATSVPGSKRSFDDLDDDSEDSYEKKLKLDGADSEDSDPDFRDDEDDEDFSGGLNRRSLSLKKSSSGGKVMNPFNKSNGIGGNAAGSKHKLPDNILIPDAKGVVRISQKQLPSLSSGVYIMSKSSGIIKLDAAASKIATSGGQAIVKVNPKSGSIGQTQIKIIKKDDVVKGTTKSGTSNNTIDALKALMGDSESDAQQSRGSSLKGSSTDPKKVLSSLNTSSLLKKSDSLERIMADDLDEESDDGLEELEFPKEIEIPQPESPPSEFTLDPETGKIAGKEYPADKPVEINDSIDNIVKLAAADITEEDLKPEPVPIGTKKPASILNTALANSNILQKTLETTRNKIQSPRMLQTQQSVIKNRPPTLTRPQSMSQFQQRSNAGSLIARMGSAGRGGNLVGSRQPYSTSPRMQPQQQQLHVQRHRVVDNNIYKPARGRLPTTGVNSQFVSRNLTKDGTRMPTSKSAVISMPSLGNDDEQQDTIMIKDNHSKEEIIAVPATTATTLTEADLSSFALTDGERPVYITGDDGTIYQVAGQNEEGQTILLTQDSDGQQQCLLVTNEIAADELQHVEQQQQHQTVVGVATTPNEEATSTGDSSSTIAAAVPTGTDGENVANLHAESESAASSETPMETESSVVAGTTATEVQGELGAQDALEVAAEEQPVVAQFIRTEPPSPGGTHKVVVMLPDGECMITQVSPEEYASLELSK